MHLAPNRHVAFGSNGVKEQVKIVLLKKVARGHVTAGRALLWCHALLSDELT